MYADLLEASKWDPTVHAFVVMIEAGRMSREEGATAMALALANDKARLLRELTEIAASRPVNITFSRRS